MRQIAYLVLLNSNYPNNLTFPLSDAQKAAKELCPKALDRLTKGYREPYSANQLAALFAEYSVKENRHQVISRIRREFSEYWQQAKV